MKNHIKKFFSSHIKSFSELKTQILQIPNKNLISIQFKANLLLASHRHICKKHTKRDMTAAQALLQCSMFEELLYKV